MAITSWTTSRIQVRDRGQTLAYTMGLSMVGSLLIALCAQVSFALPFTHVPFTLQPQAVLFIAAVLGRKRGVFAVATYLAEGSLGLPVFVQGHGGWIWFAGTTGGYLLSYLPVAYVVGALFEKCGSCGLLRAAVIFATGNAFVLAVGGLWLSIFVGPLAAWNLGVVPFLATDALKIIILLGLLPIVHGGRSVIARLSPTP